MDDLHIRGSCGLPLAGVGSPRPSSAPLGGGCCGGPEQRESWRASFKTQLEELEAMQTRASFGNNNNSSNGRLSAGGCFSPSGRTSYAASDVVELSPTCESFLAGGGQQQQPRASAVVVASSSLADTDIMNGRGSAAPATPRLSIEGCASLEMARKSRRLLIMQQQQQEEQQRHDEENMKPVVDEASRPSISFSSSSPSTKATKAASLEEEGAVVVFAAPPPPEATASSVLPTTVADETSAAVTMSSGGENSAPSSFSSSFSSSATSTPSLSQQQQQQGSFSLLPSLEPSDWPILRRFRSVNEIKNLSSQQLSSCLRELREIVATHSEYNKGSNSKNDSAEDNDYSSDLEHDDARFQTTGGQQQQQQQQQQHLLLHSEKVAVVVELLKRLGCDVANKNNNKRLAHTSTLSPLLPWAAPSSSSGYVNTGGHQPQQQPVVSFYFGDADALPTEKLSEVSTRQKQQQEKKLPAMKFGSHHHYGAPTSSCSTAGGVSGPTVAQRRRQRACDDSEDHSAAPMLSESSLGAREIFERVRSAVREGTISTLPARDLDFFLSRKMLADAMEKKKKKMAKPRNFLAPPPASSVVGGDLPRLKKDKVAMCIDFVSQEEQNEA